MSVLSATKGAAPTKASAAMAMNARKRVLSLVTSTYVGTHRKHTADNTTVQIQRFTFGNSKTDADKLLGTPPPLVIRAMV
jgi:hypothetical protein